MAIEYTVNGKEVTIKLVNEVKETKQSLEIKKIQMEQQIAQAEQNINVARSDLATIKEILAKMPDEDKK